MKKIANQYIYYKLLIIYIIEFHNFGEMMKKKIKSRIKSIYIEKLFGYFTYTIEPKEQKDLIIMYGDNGCGKTTILNILFHALAPEDSKGHRTFIAKTPFKKLIIDFVDGHLIEISRKTATEGSFYMSITKDTKQKAIYYFETDFSGTIKDVKETQYRPILRALEKLNLGLFLLPDNRKIISNLYDDEELHAIPVRTWETKILINESRESFREDINTYVKLALKRATNWTNKQNLFASSQGETDTGKIYSEIVQRIAGSKEPKSKQRQPSFKTMIREAKKLKERSLTFSKYGLSTTVELSDIFDVIENVSDDNKKVITQILMPYIRSIKARFKALEELRETIETFAGIFEEFYNYKSLNFNLKTGFKIQSDYGSKALSPEILSSGEKQLLLLFCNVLLARSRPSLFLIDEPELSLNIKWQRKLISSLMSCVKGCDVQFIFATHSIEMLSLHNDSTLKLISES